MKEARFYERAGDGRLRCRLCRQECLIAPGKRGLCGVRENHDGRLLSLVYGRPAAQAVDPIEKKPLYHFLPGSHVFSFGTRGCNFRCLHCQNCGISQVSTDEAFSDPRVEPEDIVSKALALGCAGIAYTYTEPTIFFEYACDIAALARGRGLKNIFVTNGYIGEDALRTIAPLLDAANIDLKFFRDDLYRKVCGARLQPVLDTIRLHHDLGIWIEITTLVIPGYNDDAEQLGRIAGFLAGMDRNIPWHLSAFHPAYKLGDALPTPPSTLEEGRRIGLAAGLRHVYLGNVRARSDTLCPGCGTAVIERDGFGRLGNHLTDGQCPSCTVRIGGVWT